MIRKSGARKASKKRNRKQSQSKRSNKQSLANGYSALEHRLLLAFTGGFDGTTLTLTQTVDDGAVTIDNNGASDAFQATDSSGTTTFDAATNLVVNMLDGTSNQLDLDLDNAHAGDVELNLSDGTRAVNFTGASNAIGGSLTVTAGSDAQTVEIAVGANLSVGVDASFDLGAGIDTVDEDGNNVSILGNLGLVGVNEFENNGTMAIGGNVTVDVSGETETTRFDDDNEMAIGGDFTYTGGDGRDEILLNDIGVTTVGGNVYVDLADNTVGGTQFMWWNSVDTTITGNVTVLSTSSANPDDVQDIAGATVNGDISIDLGDGANEADLLGTFGGSTVDYTGGSGVDEVVYDMSGSLADVTISLGQGNDSFVLGSSVTISADTLIVDFGDNNDLFTNNFGQFTFDTQLLGIDGFNHAYISSTDTYESTQIAAPAGLVTVDNNGTGGAFQVTNTVTTELFPAANLTVNMLNSGASDLDVTLDNPHLGDLTINLGDGTRALNLDGTGNSMSGNLTIIGGTDDQTLEIAVNNTLTVGGDLLFDLGTGIDVADEDNNDIAVTGNWDFIGVNFFENGGTMTVGGNVTIDSTVETEDTLFDDDATMTINGDYTYIGGDGRDESTMNGVAGGTSILGNANVDVGDNTVGGVQFVFFNLPNASVDGTLTVTSTSAINIDSFSLHPSASFGDDISVDLGDGPNDAGFSGTFGGSNVEYFGGSGIDTVFYGMNGNFADVDIDLGAGDDTFSLGAGATISETTLNVDYGGGIDNFINGYGQFDFNANFLNMDNFNRFYTAATDQWNMAQLVDNGDVTVDNNGPGNAIQLTHSYTTSMSPASNVRVNLLDGSTSNLEVDMGSALTGNLILDMKNGDRDVDFIGTSNTFGGFLMITAGDGSQDVDLSVNSALTVTDSVVVQLGMGHDIVDDDGNDINITDTLIFRGVNEFENEGTVNVGAMTMNTSFEVETSRIDNDGAINVANNMVYIGGEGKDDIIFNDGVSIQGYTSLDVGENTGPESVQTVNLRGLFNGRNLYVFGGDSLGGNSVLTNATTVMNGAVIVDFSTTTTNNFAILDGVFGGNFGFYRGGSGEDVVSVGLVGGDVDLHMQLGAGEDTVNLSSDTHLNLFLVNFGDDVDTFNDEFFGIYPFATLFGNLP